MKERNRKNGSRVEDMGSGRGPMGRRGHTACVYGDEYMLIYGGYRDLKGSLHDLWAFHFSKPTISVLHCKVSYASAYQKIILSLLNLQRQNRGICSAMAEVGEQVVHHGGLLEVVEILQPSHHLDIIIHVP